MRNDERSQKSMDYPWRGSRAVFAPGYSRPVHRSTTGEERASSVPHPSPLLGLGRWSRAANENASGNRSRRGSAILNTQAYAVAPLLFDAALIVLLSIVSGVSYHLIVFRWPGDISVFAGAGILVSVLFCGILHFKALRFPFGLSFSYERARDALWSWISAFGLFVFVAFTTKMASSLSRGAILSFFLVGACGVLVSRVKIPILFKKSLGRTALDGADLIVVGPSDQVACLDVVNDLRELVNREPCFVGYESSCADEQWAAEVASVLYNAQKQAHGAGPGEILVVASGVVPSRLNDILDGLAWLPRPICIIPDDWTASVLRQKRAVIGKSIALEFQRAPLNAMQRAAKRAMDLAVAGAALAILAPLMIAIGLAIKLDSPGPVMFRQSRTGYRGRIFRIFKYRTMSVLEDGPAIKQAQKHDSRVTRVGRFLRRSSLDELPQILNVIAGDMSLVGPRPHAVGHDRDYEAQIPNYTLRQHILPGITGWAQINGLRGETSTTDAMHRRVEHDIWYLRNCSIALDVRILARTVFEIMRARNAY